MDTLLRQIMALPQQVKSLCLIMAFSVFLVNPVLAADMKLEGKKLMVFGDSLSAGYGLPLDQSFPSQLEKKLKEKGYGITVINAGVSGDTSSGGVSRIDWALGDKPDYVILELGGNDMMRGTDPKLTRDNLQKILETLKKRNIPVLVAGMKSFRNMGEIFGGSYERMYKDLADEYDAVYYPFFLDGVALDARYNQEDGIHPNAAGVAIIVDNIFDKVEDLLEK